MTQEFKINGKYFDKKTTRVTLGNSREITIFKFTCLVDKDDPEFNINFGGVKVYSMKTSRTLSSDGEFYACFELETDGENALKLFDELIKQDILPEII